MQVAARGQAVIDDQHAQALDLGDIDVFRRIQVVGSGIQGARQLLFGERLGDDAAGAGLAHRFEHLGPGFTGHQDEGHGVERRLGAHGGHQVGTGQVGQVQAADHHGALVRLVQGGERRAGRVDVGDLLDALVFQHALDQMRLHGRGLDQQDGEIGQGSSQGHAVAPQRGE